MTKKEAIEELRTRYLTMSQCLDKEELNRANIALDMAIEALDQEPKTAHWIVNKEKSLARCSNCKFLLKNKDEIKLFGTFIQGYSYCPYCGYRMIEPQDKTKQGLAYADQDTLMSAT